MSSEAMTADVVVIGAGGSGLAAAIEAAQLGRSVIVLEKNPAAGGSTAWSIGSVSATNTPHQQREGIQDSPNEHFEDLGLFAGDRVGRDNPALRRLLVENAHDTFDWLLERGVVFVGPMPEAPHRYPRMHNVVPTSRAFIHHLVRDCRRLGVSIRGSSPVESLVQEHGRIVGARTKGGEVYRARRAVVLASGDFSGSADLKRRFGSEHAALAAAVNVTNTGDGHRIAMSLGASVVNGDIIHGPIMRFVPPSRKTLLRSIPPYKIVGSAITWAMRLLPAAILRPFLMSFVTTALGPDPGLFRAGAVLVNRNGNRIASESGPLALSLAQQPEGEGYIILDDRLAAQFENWPNFISTAPGVAYAYLADYRRNRRDVYHQARSLQELAEQLSMSPDVLRDAVGTAISQPPFIALGPVKSYVVLTDGGLKVSERLEVLGEQDRPIPGLLAAGAVGQGGLLLFGHGHHLLWAFVSGRIAGRNAALMMSPQQTVGEI